MPRRYNLRASTQASDRIPRRRRPSVVNNQRLSLVIEDIANGVVPEEQPLEIVYEANVPAVARHETIAVQTDDNGEIDYSRVAIKEEPIDDELIGQLQEGILGFRVPPPPPALPVREERITRQLEQEYIDISKKNYKDARREYKLALSTYHGDFSKRDDHGWRYMRGLRRREEEEEDMELGEEDREGSVEALDGQDPLEDQEPGQEGEIVEEARANGDHLPNLPNCIRPVRPEFFQNLIPRKTIGAPVFHPEGASNSWRTWTAKQVAEWVSNFLDNEQHARLIMREEISGLALEYLLADTQRLYSIGFPHGTIVLMENHFNAVFNAFHGHH
uniref:SAM domain-containing protein n=1 Tax=Caenorhabditis tropicalis TaxID=1561998 RepID=A0A1I7UXA8_9PELO